VIAAVVSALHVLALAIGLPALLLRGRALRGQLDADGVRRVLAADSAWGIAAVLWVATGLLRAFAGLEKGTQFYLHSSLFWLKMTLFVGVLALEAWPMATFIAWRRRLGRGEAVDTSRTRGLYAVNHAQLVLVVVMVFVASFMARGFGVR
jgi:putative membrane protein